MSYLRSPLITSLDIGSSKICCMVAEKEKAGTFRVIGLGHNVSAGIKRGIITDMHLAEESIYNAISEAEKQASKKISGVIASISTTSIESKRLSVEIEIENNEINKNDVENGYLLASKKNELLGNVDIHTFPVDYSIDGLKGVKNPLGMFGDVLGLDLNIVSVKNNSLKTLIKCITKCDVDVYNVATSSYAAGLSILKEEEMNIGAVVIDMGASTSSLGVFLDGKMVFTKIIPFGGDEITLELARYFSISIEEAEKLKVMHASAIEGSDDAHVILEIPKFAEKENIDPIQITRSDLVSVCKPKVEEIFNLLKEYLFSSGYEGLIGKNLVLTGGACQLDGVTLIARDIFRSHVRIGIPINLRSPNYKINETTFSVSCGLIESVTNINISDNSSSDIKYRNEKKGIEFSKIKNWIGENFL